MSIRFICEYICLFIMLDDLFLLDPIPKKPMGVRMYVCVCMCVYMYV